MIQVRPIAYVQVAFMALATTPLNAGTWVTSDNNTVGHVDSQGVVTTVVATGLSNPQGLAFDPTTGNLLVANAGSGVIRRFDANTGTDLGIFAFLGSSDAPYDLAIIGDNLIAAVPARRAGDHGSKPLDPSGNLLFTDIRSPETGFSTVRRVSFDELGNPGEPTLFATQNLVDAWDVATDAFGRLYVSDVSTHRVQRFRVDGAFANTFVPSAPLQSPMGLVIGDTGILTIANYGLSNIHQLQVGNRDLGVLAALPARPHFVVLGPDPTQAPPGPIPEPTSIVPLAIGLVAASVRMRRSGRSRPSRREHRLQ